MAYYAGWNKGGYREYQEKLRNHREARSFFGSDEESLGYVSVSGGRLKIEFRYDAYLVSEVRKLEGRKYHPNGKYWTADKSIGNISKLRRLGFSVSHIPA